MVRAFAVNVLCEQVIGRQRSLLRFFKAADFQPKLGMGVQSASTVVSALGARSAVVHQSACTVEYVQGARSVAPRINSL